MMLTSFTKCVRCGAKVVRGRITRSPVCFNCKRNYKRIYNILLKLLKKKLIGKRELRKELKIIKNQTIMIYKITAIRSKDVVWSGGTFKKFEVRTDKTGSEILEMQIGQKRSEKIKVGDTVKGYLSNNTFNSKNGPMTVKVLKGISAEYVYDLLLKIDPTIETGSQVLSEKEQASNFDEPSDSPFPEEASFPN